MSKLYDFESSIQQTYTKQCECGEVHEVSTQPDQSPEYYTTIFIKCGCGKSVEFELPVN